MLGFGPTSPRTGLVGKGFDLSEWDEGLVRVIARVIDRPTAYRGGPSSLARRKAVEALNELEASGYRISLVPSQRRPRNPARGS